MDGSLLKKLALIAVLVARNLSNSGPGTFGARGLTRLLAPRRLGA